MERRGVSFGEIGGFGGHFDQMSRIELLQSYFQSINLLTDVSEDWDDSICSHNARFELFRSNRIVVC